MTNKEIFVSVVLSWRFPATGRKSSETGTNGDVQRLAHAHEKMYIGLKENKGKCKDDKMDKWVSEK